MTDQELFDKVLAHCHQQGVAAVGKQGKCMYRGDEGRSCAAGCVIRDEHYIPAIEGRVVAALLDGDRGLDPYDEALRSALLKSGIPREQWRLLSALQHAHDDEMPRTKGDSMHGFNLAMHAVAQRHGLKFESRYV